MRLFCERPLKGTSAWNVREPARVTRLGSETVPRIRDDVAMRPHKVHHCCRKSPDPEFDPKEGAIVGLYLAPPDKALILSIDEKSQLQALDRTQPELSWAQFSQETDGDIYSAGTPCFPSALSLREGLIKGRCINKNTHEEFLKLLKTLYRRCPRKHFHVILDNLTHKHMDVLAWASKRRRLTVHFTATYASWLDQVEMGPHFLQRRSQRKDLAFKTGTS